MGRLTWLKLQIFATGLLLISNTNAQSLAPAPESELPGYLGPATQCRFDPASAHDYCGLPIDLSNFQGYFQCSDDVKIGRPTSIEQAQNQVALYIRVKANGVGHSWNKEQFCSGNTSDSINIVLTELTSVVDFIKRPIDPKIWTITNPIPPNFPIIVDEEKQQVTVASGIPQRLLMKYLASYKYGKEPRGWALPAYSWFIDQTIGGAVATGTHGSSFQWGSLSSQLRGLKVILANGTLLELTAPQDNPHLWRALGVSVGRLGVITEVTLRIVPANTVTRIGANMTFADFITTRVKPTQDAYVAAKALNDTEGIQKALSQLDETQAMWVPIANQIFVADFIHDDKSEQDVYNVVRFDGTKPLNVPGVFDQVTKQPVPPSLLQTDADATIYFADLYVDFARQNTANGTFPRGDRAFLAMSETSEITSAVSAPYEQYEVAVPMEIAADCLALVDQAVYGGEEKLFEGFRTPPLIRFVSGEEFYISPTNGGPRMYVNMEDLLSLSTGKPNEKFEKVVQLFLDRCDARLHWGKAGWPKFNKCFDGAKDYADTWCDFGCAVQELDPSRKFKSESTVWRWNATMMNGQPLEAFGSCCTAQGFKHSECRCELSPLPGECEKQVSAGRQ